MPFASLRASAKAWRKRLYGDRICVMASGVLPIRPMARLVSGVQIRLRLVSALTGTRGRLPSLIRSKTTELVRLCVLPGP